MMANKCKRRYIMEIKWVFLISYFTFIRRILVQLDYSTNTTKYEKVPLAYRWHYRTYQVKSTVLIGVGWRMASEVKHEKPL